MTLISPPPDRLPDIELPNQNDREATRRVQLYLNVKPWKCPECGSKVFGRVLYCVYCKFVLHKDTPRPNHYTKEKGA